MSDSFEELIVLVSNDLGLALASLLEGINKRKLDKIQEASDTLIGISSKYSSRLKEERHSILSFTLRDAGLELWARTKQISSRSYLEDDHRYFKEIYDSLSEIKASMDSGEYKAELDKLRKAKLKT
ncbi:MAG: hypothetical protein QXS21_00500 [Thermoproteota archaeon]|nr:hypothetical protein [Candidatus Brockarchaeota archaeon]MBO3768565.1 hypothetical protein [Candidatus Brockarchaeota archaeon]MBO3800861.1 hypothetical protein [Candidatus Brockarchaeota archaeon]